MFLCECGGIFLVIELENFPKDLSGKEKIEYERKCTVECSYCGKIKEDQSFD